MGNPRALANFPVQANAAEMLRLACCLLVERGVRACAPVHDAVLVEGPADAIDEVVAETRIAMAEASKLVLRGFETGTDVKIVRSPDRYIDEAGAAFWSTVMRLAGSAEDNSSSAEPVQHFCRPTLAVLPNRSGLIEKSHREGLFYSLQEAPA